MLQDILSNKPSDGWNLTFGSGYQKVKDNFYLVDMVSRVILNLHELSDQSDHSWEFALPEKYLVDKQLLIALYIISHIFIGL